MQADHPAHIYCSKENFKSRHNAKLQSQPKKRCFGKELLNVPRAPVEEEPLHTEEPAPSVLAELPQVDCSDRKSVLAYESLILEHLKGRLDVYAVDREFMARQPDIDGKMRSILVDWLVDVSMKFRLSAHTLFLTVNLIDRYLAVREVGKLELQLLGVTALMTQCKYEEVYPPQLKDFVAVCDNAYSAADILQMEAEILDALEFDLTQPTTLYFLDIIQLRLKMDDKPLAFARYILETALLEVAAVKHNNLLLVAGAVFLVFKIFKLGSWTCEHDGVFGLPDSQVKTCAKELYMIMQKIDASTLSAVKRKFATPQFSEVSKYKIEKVNGARQ